MYLRHLQHGWRQENRTEGEKKDIFFPLRWYAKTCSFLSDFAPWFPFLLLSHLTMHTSLLLQPQGHSAGSQLSPNTSALSTAPLQLFFRLSVKYTLLKYGSKQRSWYRCQWLIHQKRSLASRADLNAAGGNTALLLKNTIFDSVV